jgi:hypothetical protein
LRDKARRPHDRRGQGERDPPVWPPRDGARSQDLEHRHHRQRQPVVGFRLKVYGDGIEPFETETKALINRLDIPRIQPGIELAVMYDPEDHRRVALDIYDERR